MSVLLTSIEIKDDAVTDRTAAKILREGMRKIAHEHRMVTMGKHFQKNAETSPGGGYGYKPRSSKYVERKLRKYGTDIPNVRTGALMRHTKTGSYVTATQYKSTLHIKAPPSWSAKTSGSRSGLNDDRRMELEAITPAEVKDSQELGAKYVREEFANPANRRSRKRRVV